MRRKYKPVITITEIFGRARDSLELEIQHMKDLAEIDELPYETIRDDVERRQQKIRAINEMRFYFTGEYR